MKIARAFELLGVKAHLLLRGVGGVLRRRWRGVVLQLKIETQY
jgi:hypothetical protein